MDFLRKITGYNYVVEEKRRWTDHSLQINMNKNDRYCKLLDEMTSCYVAKYERNYCGFKYDHWYIRDRRTNYVLEFDGDNLYEAEIKITLKNIKNSDNEQIIREFKMDGEVKNRAKEILGCENYSLILRNCEHTVNYIVVDTWRSLQTTNNESTLYKAFGESLISQNKYINKRPKELQLFVDYNFGKTYDDNIKPLFNDSSISRIYNGDNKNIVIPIIGPTGVGKSLLINLLFNQYCVKSEASILSVTKNIGFIYGTHDYNDKVYRSCILDTIGFCDSIYKPEEVLKELKFKLRNEVVGFNKIIIIVDGRLSKDSILCIQNILDWSDYKNNKAKFLFLINKTNDLRRNERTKLIDDMLDLFNLSYTIGNKCYIYAVDFKHDPDETLEVIDYFLNHDYKNQIKFVKSCNIV